MNFCCEKFNEFLIPLQLYRKVIVGGEVIYFLFFRFVRMLHRNRFDSEVKQYGITFVDKKMAASKILFYG